METEIMQKRRDRELLAFAKQYLLNLPGVTTEILEKHIIPNLEQPAELTDLFQKMLSSATNAGMKRQVILDAMGGDIRILAPLLCDFSPPGVMDEYHNDGKRLLEDIIDKIKPRGKINRGPKSLWPRFCRTILSGAAFFAQFETASDFYAWVEIFDVDDKTSPALPLLLDREIDGLGFALACDFIKELGYMDFAKPDVHLKKIFKELSLSTTENDYEVFKAIVRVARNNNISPYTTDKMFWLAATGNFGKLKVKTNRPKFISEAKAYLGAN